MTKEKRPSLCGALQTMARDERGAVAVIGAALFPVLLGAMAIGAEAGFWQLKQRKLQHAADVSVHAAAVRQLAGDAAEKLEGVALTVATGSGYLPAVGTIDVGPATGGPGGASRIAVRLTETHPRLFSSIYSADPISLAARAVAEVTGRSNACVLALSGTAPGAVTVTGSTTVGLTDCSVASNSTAADAFTIGSGGSKITTDCVYSSGGAVVTTGLTLTQCGAPVERAPRTLDPYADVPEPDRLHIDQLPCRDINYISSSTYAMDIMADGTPAIRFCGGLDIKGNITLKPGLYIMDGGALSASGSAVVDGTAGVTFYFAGNASSKLPGNGDLTLSSPTEGTYAGLLFFGNRSATDVEHVVTGNSTSIFQGSIYMPASHLTFTGNSSVSGACTQIVADRITFTGNSNIETGCTSGMKEIMVGGTVALVE